MRTLDFIQLERRDVVEHCLKTIVGYREPDELFLSGTTGMALHPDSRRRLVTVLSGRRGSSGSTSIVCARGMRYGPSRR